MLLSIVYCKTMNVLLPMNSTKYVYHVGHGNDLRSIVRNGLILGRFSTKTGRYAVFFTVVDPMDDKRGFRETFCDLSQARIATYRNTWRHLRNTVYWCNLLPAQERGLRFYQTRSDAVLLYDTLPAEYIEKAICMKTGEQLYQRESERPRVALKANSQCGLQDLPSQEARSSLETQSEVRSFWETGCNIVSYRIPGISLSNGSRAGWTKTTNSRQVDREVWIPQVQGTISSRYEPEAEDQQVQWSIAKVAERHESNRNLRALREH